MQSVLCGIFGGLVFFGLLLLAALLADGHKAIMDARIPIARGCLLLSAFLCALTAGRRKEQGRLLHALCAEGALGILLVVCGVLLRSDTGLLSIAVDLALLLFGAFAGTMVPQKQRVKRRGKR